MEFRKVLWEDANKVAYDLSQVDRWECDQFVPNVSLTRFIRASLAASGEAWAMTHEGKTVGLIGIVGETNRAWFMTTETLLAHKREFLKASREWMAKVNPRDNLEATFHRDNIPTRRWLRWLGWSERGETRSSSGVPMVTLEWSAT